MIWDNNFALNVLPLILQGLEATVLITVIGTAIAMCIGLILAIMRRSRAKWISWPAEAFVEFVRDTPLLVQLYFLYFGLPVFGIFLSALVTGIIGIGINYSAYTSEVYRAGIENVPRGQWEAARALNFSHWQTWIRIILPQAIRRVIPALGNYFIAMFKDTPILASIGVLEMLGQAQIIGSENFRYLEPMTVVGLLFILVSYPASLLIRRLEVRYGRVR